MPLMCHEVWFLSPTQVVRIDLPRPANIKHVMDYIKLEYQARLPDFGMAPYVKVFFLDGKLRFDFHDGMILLPDSFSNESES